ncbi:unnamed protein product, partial [Heterosigma akashiwo]
TSYYSIIKISPFQSLLVSTSCSKKKNTRTQGRYRQISKSAGKLQINKVSHHHQNKMSFDLYTLNTDTMTHKKSCVMSPTPSTWSEQTSEHNRSPVPGPHIWMLVSLMTFIITHPSKLIVLTASCTAPGLYLSASLPPPTFSLQSFSRTPHPHCHPPPVGQPSRAPPCPWGCLWQRRWRPLPPPMPAAQHPAAQPPRHQAPP